MADGSVVIDVSLNSSSFLSSVEEMEGKIASLGTSLSGVLNNSFRASGFFSGMDSSLLSLRQAATSSAQLIVSTLSSAANQACTLFSSAPWQESGASAASSLALGVRQSSVTLNEAISSVLTEVSNAFSSGWISLGQSIAADIAEGIRSSASSVSFAAQTVVDDIKASVTQGGSASSSLPSSSSYAGISSVSKSLATSAAGTAVKNTDSSAKAGNVTQNIYLSENSHSPYRTAKLILRESEAMMNL